jgi:hypothetical protein
MSATERLWLCYDKAFTPYVNQCVLEGSGHLDFGQLKSAVEKASAANPGSRLILKGVLRGAGWIDSGITPRVRRLSGEKWDGYGPENAPFLCDPLPHAGPTCEVIYLQGPVPRLVFRTNHGVMDGIGTLTWMEDIFRALRGENPIGSSSTLTEYQVARTVTDLSMKMYPLNCIAPTGRSGKFTTGMTWKRLSFSGKRPAFLGKIAMVLAKSAWNYGEGVFRIAVPVDERFRCGDIRSTGNLAMAIYIEVSKKMTPESIVYEIPRQLYKKNDCITIEGGDYLDLIPINIMAMGLKLITRIPYHTGKYSVSALINNFCQTDMGKFNGCGFEAKTMFFIPPRFEGLPAFVALTGCNGRLEMAVSIPRILADHGRFERLLDDLREALET